MVAGALPTITAIATGGPFNFFAAGASFNLTAYRNPGPYFANGNPLTNTGARQVLNGGTRSRVALKACMDKTIFVKIPVTGQVNAMGQTEFDLEAGDRIFVQMDIPNGHRMDVLVEQFIEQSAR